jgi:processive 1,2-diacylglycerol beta-glucosyltransferase
VNVLVLTMDGGNGTISASLALKEWLEGQGARCSVVDFMNETDPLGNALAAVYNRLLRGDLRLAALYQRVAQAWPRSWYTAFNSQAGKRARRLLDRERPDVVALVSPWIIDPVLDALKDRGGTRPRVLTVVVDLGEGMPADWGNPGVDRTILPTVEAREYLERRGTGIRDCAVMGMPLSPALVGGRPSAGEARRKLGVGGPLCTVLGGREGGQNSLRIADALLESGCGADILVQCGRNARLLRSARKRKGLASVGFVDSMAELYSASDVVITKPGALTVSELVALRKPFIIDATPAVMPQELGNLKFVEERRLGLVARSRQEIPGLVRSLLGGARTTGTYDIYGTPRIGAEILDGHSGGRGPEAPA